MNTRTSVLLGLALTLTGPAAFAGYPHGIDRGGDSFRDQARVVRVEPIVDVVRIPREHRECWTEEIERTRYGIDPGAAMVTGTVIGGLAGYGITHGDARPVAAAAGSLLGAVVGHSVGRESRRPATDVERRCRVFEDYERSERVVGYRVTYRYRGHTLVRRMDHDPGARLPVRVTVTPAHR